MTERILFSRSELFRLAVQQSTVPMTVQDEHMSLVMVNDAYCELVGYSEAELLGKDPLDITVSPPFHEVAEYTRKHVADSPDNKQPSRIAILRELIHRDSHRIPVRIEVAIGQGIDGSRLWCSTLIDLSDQQVAVSEANRKHDLLVRELHHRVKNDLHGLVGLIGRESQRSPQLKPSLDKVASKIKVVANIHGLQLEQGGILDPIHLVDSIISGAAQLFEPPFACTLDDAVRKKKWAILESESVPFALILNELITNASKHNVGMNQPTIDVSRIGDDLRIRISNHGKLPDGFDLSAHGGHQSGLGLVNSLIPGEGLTVSLNADGPMVVSELIARAPVLCERD